MSVSCTLCAPRPVVRTRRDRLVPIRVRVLIPRPFRNILPLTPVTIRHESGDLPVVSQFTIDASFSRTGANRDAPLPRLAKEARSG